MAQHDLDIANAAGNVVRSDINDALAALGSLQKGGSAPTGAQAGWLWLDDNTPSSTVWTLSIYDGAGWIPVALVDTTNNRHLPSGAPIWGGTAGGTANALTITSTPAWAARYPGMRYTFLVSAANTGAVTLNDNGIGAVALQRPDGTALLPRDLLPGEMVEIVWDGSAWRLTKFPEALVRLDYRVASGSTSISFALNSNFTDFELHYDGVRPSADASDLLLRCSRDGGSTYYTASGDYNNTVQATRPGSGGVLTFSDLTTGGIKLSAGADIGNTLVSVNGFVRFYVGDAARQPSFRVAGSQLEDTVAALTMHDAVAVLSSNGAIDAITVLERTGNIAIGRFRLLGRR